MRLVSFEGGFGRVEDGTVVPMGPSLADWLAFGTQSVATGAPRPLAELRLLAPVPRPGKIVCVGLNYRDHANETGQPIPSEPVLFSKYANSVVGPGADVVVPPDAGKIDYEAELAVVIGRRASAVPIGEALDHVAGYTCANDVSSRSLQFRSSQWLLGKAIDTFLPLGPYLVTADEVPDPQALGIRCLVNGELRQSSDTGQMIFGVAELVSFASRTITLEPGDVLITGTPAGVGMAADPPRYLRPGDRMRIEIDGLGELDNTVRASR
ncbi:MAG TPA: fumarylacetoacetate hydrolase family protein [Actinomycetota bacterium]|nr:fumarylacetoacetate hydrolase family protein [Actinomycetota bacterium]